MMQDQLSKHIQKCQHGDSTAFEYILKQYQQMIFTLSFRILCNEADAKDATQDTFIKVWQNISTYSQKYKFSTWIYRIASNICFDKLRKEQTSFDIDIVDNIMYSEPNQEGAINYKELINFIKNIADGLPPKQKLVFILSELEELGADEISIITGLSQAKIKSNLYLAKKYVKSKIKEDE